jgi:serine carboxypeptidase-like clade II
MLLLLLFPDTVSDVLIKTWQDSEFSMLPTYKKLMKAGLRIWVFR